MQDIFPLQHTRRICSMAHISSTCNVPVARGLTKHTHWQKRPTVGKTDIGNEHNETRNATSGKMLRSARRSVATHAVSELPLDGSICLPPQEHEFIEHFARQCRYTPPPEFSLTGKVQVVALSQAPSPAFVLDE